MSGPAASARTDLTAAFDVDLPPDEALHLFTARGETAWVAGWSPEIVGDPEDDTVVGTVFITRDARGRRTTWILTDWVPGRLVRYARVVEGGDAGTVSVSLEGTDRGCRATVRYLLRAIDAAGEVTLHDFATGYADVIASWGDDIRSYLETSVTRSTLAIGLPLASSSTSLSR